MSTASLANGQKGEGIGSLVRLVEALEMYDNGAMDSYMTEDSLESAALMKGGSGRHRRKVAALNLEPRSSGIFAVSCTVDFAVLNLLGGRIDELRPFGQHASIANALQPSEDILASYTTDPIYVPTSNGPITQKMLERFVAAEMEDEYCALPFNHDAEYAVSKSTMSFYIAILCDLQTSKFAKI